MSHRTFTWLAATLAALVLGGSHLLDADTEQQLAEAVALSLQDAQQQAAQEADRP